MSVNPRCLTGLPAGSAVCTIWQCDAGPRGRRGGVAGSAFTLVDTGGIGLVPGEKSTDVIATVTVDQVNVAIEAADAIIFVVNVQKALFLWIWRSPNTFVKAANPPCSRLTNPITISPKTRWNSANSGSTTFSP